MVTYEELKQTQTYWECRFYLEVYQEISEYIEKNGITETEFAQSLNLSVRQLQSIYSGNKNLRISELFRILHKLNSTLKIATCE